MAGKPTRSDASDPSERKSAARSGTDGTRVNKEGGKAPQVRSEGRAAPVKKSKRMAEIDLLAEESPKTISKSGATDAEE